MVPGLFAHSERYSLLYSSYEMSTKAEEYTGGGTWHAWYLRWYLECMVPGMVPGMYVHSYVCYAWSTKTVEYVVPCGCIRLLQEKDRNKTAHKCSSL